VVTSNPKEEVKRWQNGSDPASPASYLCNSRSGRAARLWVRDRRKARIRERIEDNEKTLRGQRVEGALDAAAAQHAAASRTDFASAVRYPVFVADGAIPGFELRRLAVDNVSLQRRRRVFIGLCRLQLAGQRRECQNEPVDGRAVQRQRQWSASKP